MFCFKLVLCNLVLAIQGEFLKTQLNYIQLTILDRLMKRRKIKRAHNEIHMHWKKNANPLNNSD